MAECQEEPNTRREPGSGEDKRPAFPSVKRSNMTEDVREMMKRGAERDKGKADRMNVAAGTHL